MAIQSVLAQLACADLEQSRPWFEKLFGRAPDAAPMKGLLEWRQGAAGLQLFQQPEHSGHGTLTLVVSKIADERVRLATQGLAPGELERGDATTLVRLRDPDGNTVVLAEPT
jgi:hypothetical protein